MPKGKTSVQSDACQVRREFGYWLYKSLPSPLTTSTAALISITARCLLIIEDLEWALEGKDGQ